MGRKVGLTAGIEPGDATPSQGIGRREIKLHLRDFLALATIIH